MHSLALGFVPPISLTPILAQAATSPDGPTDAAAALFRQFLAERSSYELGAMTGALVMSIIIQILAYWISAKVIVGNEHATLARASQLWVLNALAAIGMGILLFITLLLASSIDQPIMVLVLIGGWSLLTFVIVLLLPAKVFRTDFLRSLGILLLSLILVLAAQVAVAQARGYSALAELRPLQALIFDSSEGRQRRIREMTRGDSLASIEMRLDQLSSPAERKKTFSERQAELRSVFDALEHRRKTLKATDKIETADYEAVRKRYEDLVQLMRADYSASQTQPPSR